MPDLSVILGILSLVPYISVMPGGDRASPLSHSPAGKGPALTVSLRSTPPLRFACGPPSYDAEGGTCPAGHLAGGGATFSLPFP